MFQINAFYTIMSYIIITLIYLYINNYHKDRNGFEAIFKEAIFQLNRKLQVYMQRNKDSHKNDEWRPAAVCVSPNSFEREKVFDLMKWISYKHGFGTYFHFIEDYFSRQSYDHSHRLLDQLILEHKEKNNSLYIDTMISPSYTTAIAQTIQSPSISGMENNMIIFEFEKSKPEELTRIVDNINLTRAGDYDVCIFGQSNKPIKHKNGIHVWIKPVDLLNANLMILLGYIILSHPDWKKSHIKIFSFSPSPHIEEARKELNELVKSGRLPITLSNIEIIPLNDDTSTTTLINEYSADAALTILGFREEKLKHNGPAIFDGYDQIGDILFVNSIKMKNIK